MTMPETENAPSNRPVPQVTDRAMWQARIDELRVKEKAHTRAGDALAAERRRSTRPTGPPAAATN
jgi:predicted dithiol-disulfide oxidoreductase (DUF899 family)